MPLTSTWMPASVYGTLPLALISCDATLIFTCSANQSRPRITSIHSPAATLPFCVTAKLRICSKVLAFLACAANAWPSVRLS
ncbi:hypothetical protein D3C73_1535550 [compost metagenome]